MSHAKDRPITPTYITHLVYHSHAHNMTLHICKFTFTCTQDTRGMLAWAHSTHACKHWNTHAHTNAHRYTHKRTHVCTHTHTQTQACMHTHAHMHTTQSHYTTMQDQPVYVMSTGPYGHLAAHYTPSVCPVCVHIKSRPSWQTADIHLDVSSCWPSSGQWSPAKHLPDHSIP